MCGLSFFDPFYFAFQKQNNNNTRENNYFSVKMTRFARSKGSKASNERVEEEATPWEELKVQIKSIYFHVISDIYIYFF